MHPSVRCVVYDYVVAFAIFSGCESNEGIWRSMETWNGKDRTWRGVAGYDDTHLFLHLLDLIASVRSYSEHDRGREIDHRS